MITAAPPRMISLCLPRTLFLSLRNVQGPDGPDVRPPNSSLIYGD